MQRSKRRHGPCAGPQAPRRRASACVHRLACGVLPPPRPCQPAPALVPPLRIPPPRRPHQKKVSLKGGTHPPTAGMKGGGSLGGGCCRPRFRAALRGMALAIGGLAGWHSHKPNREGWGAGTGLKVTPRPIIIPRPPCRVRDCRRRPLAGRLRQTRPRPRPPPRGLPLVVVTVGLRSSRDEPERRA